MYAPIEAQTLISETLQRALCMRLPTGYGKGIFWLAFSERMIVDRRYWGCGVQRNSTQPYEH